MLNNLKQNVLFLILLFLTCNVLLFKRIEFVITFQQKLC